MLCVFFGIKLLGGLIFGNYLGVIKCFVDMQGGQFEMIYCVVDFYVIIVWQDFVELCDVICEVVVGYLVFGIDLEQLILFNQVQVLEYVEFGWIFNCVVCVGWMNCMI